MQSMLTNWQHQFLASGRSAFELELAVGTDDDWSGNCNVADDQDCVGVFISGLNQTHAGLMTIDNNAQQEQPDDICTRI